MKNSFYIIVLVIASFFVSCDKPKEVQVNYRITNSISGFDVNYRDMDGNLVTEKVETQSAQDQWTYNYTTEEGEIVFVSARYTDINSAILIQILIDGKVYKEGSSNADTVKYLTVSGTVPFD